MNASFLKRLQSRPAAMVLFTLALVYLCSDMQLFEMLWEPPSGIHQWRQTDGASMAMMYYQEGNSLWQPMIHNQLGDDGSAGGEFPIVYYLAGQMYHLIGPHDIIIRAIHFMLFGFGLLLFVFHTIPYFKNAMVVVFPVLLAIASPTLMYYAMNFLPDGGGWGLGLAGLALFLRHTQNHESTSNRYLIYSAICFMLAGLIKVSMLLPFFSIIGYVGFTLISPMNRPLLKLRQALWFSALTLLPVVAWYLYIASYNAAHDSAYFATAIRPYWLASAAMIEQTSERISEAWLPLILPEWMRYCLLGSIIVIVAFARHIPRLFLGLSVMSTLGIGFHILLFFINLHDHDYYFIPLYYPVLLIMLSAFIALDNVITKSWLRYSAFLVGAILCWQSSANAVRITKQNYRGWFRDYSLTSSIYTIEPFLEKHGISKGEKVFVPLDASSNQALYFVNRKGWTELTGIYDSAPLDSIIAKGAEYVIVMDTSFYSITYLKYHITDTIGYHNEIGVYRIGHSKWWKGE